ncbi:hypothetical protein SAMN04488096_104201 [Mesonia phycicola]|uniref:DUF6371 domain-containing protein n=1 Tax=Mesonia phycicola TaxID=579105 RepID=A0A1M6DWA1_9FLAO|nr:DUF6371 domain-containing protein [Mesonia phycicola]SHI77455.1 hypothetical protein SAMN04488096_104201 [Mesonia phycicola]
MNKKELKFDKNRRRVKYCPCGKNNKDGKFVPYNNFETKGYCHSCGETFLPNLEMDTIQKPFVYVKPQKPTYHDPKLVAESGQNFKNNNFIQQLKKDFDKELIKEAISKYLIGTSKHWQGSTVFWQIDNNQKVRHGKIMLYDIETGKRLKKEEKTFISSVRSVLKLKNHHFKQCLFGLHLINEFPDKKIAIVESEKTAIKMSMFKPEYNWLATGGKSLLKYEYLKVLKDKSIMLFPDKGAYNEWNNVASELLPLGFNIKVSEWLESTDYPDNTDLADLLIYENTKKLNKTYSSELEKLSIKSKTEMIADKLANRNPKIYNLIETFDLADNNGCKIGRII